MIASVCGNLRRHDPRDDTVTTFPDVVISVDKIIYDEDGNPETIIPIDKAARKNKPQDPT